MKHIGRMLGASVLAGVFSSMFVIIYPPFYAVIAWAVVLSVSLTLGVAMTNALSRSRLDFGQRPSILVVLLAALAAGLLAGAVNGLIPEPILDFGMGHSRPVPPHRPMILPCLAYSLLMLMAYQLRWEPAPSKTRSLFWTCAIVALAGVLAGMFKSALLRPGSGGISGLDAPIGMGLFSGVPFALAWFVAMKQTDPAFSLERWKRISSPTVPPESKSDSSEGKALEGE